MRKETMKGSTTDLAEIIIDYKEGQTEIKDVPPETLYNRLKTAFIEWAFGKFTLAYAVLAILVSSASNKFNWEIIKYITTENIILVWLGLSTILTLCHINRKFDAHFKKKFALATGNRKRNKATVNNIKGNVFVLYDFKNIVLDFVAKGDISKQLNKIHIRKENRACIMGHYATVGSFSFLDNVEEVWNAYFYFDKVPKNGELNIEWI
jgi:hypothetical protein